MREHSPTDEFIEIRGAREHNLKNIFIKIPRNKLVVLTGLSGSGKSTLAFDTIYAEGQRRYLESLSSYAKQFLDKLKKPDVDVISGLSPAISIEQNAASHNPRSTVATITEIYDYLRLFFAKLGIAHCPICGDALQSQTRENLLREVKTKFAGKDICIFAPMVRGRKGEFQKLFQESLKKGYDTARIDGVIKNFTKETKLRKTMRHNIEILIDELTVTSNESRLKNSLACALDLTQESASIIEATFKNDKTQEPFFLSTSKTCPRCQVSVPDLTPNMFSFNSPYGACPKCKGLGKLSQISGVIADPQKPLMRALHKDAFFSFNKYFFEDLLYDLTEKFHFEWDTPYEEWSEEAKEALFFGSGDISGLVEEWEKLFHGTNSEQTRAKIRKFLREEICPDCGGKRLRKESLGVLVGGKNIAELTALSVDNAIAFWDAFKTSEAKELIAKPILREIRERQYFLKNIGLGYLTLDRTSASLAGGELQRIRLAAQLGIGLTGVLYVLDEPSIGLHPRDNEKLIQALEHLRDLKNTVLVVEHDEETMRRADYVIDLGPGAGNEGGEIVAQGKLSEMGNFPNSLTLQYLFGKRKIEIPKARKKINSKKIISLKGCREHNLKNINVEFPVGLMTCVTGVSGSGKSTLVYDILYKELHNRIWKTEYKVGAFEKITCAEHFDKILSIDQEPIGRTPRSNPATYTDILGLIRQLFSDMELSKIRRYDKSRFSFNLKGGRCEKCRGAGFEKLEMSFMPDMFVVCETCQGKRYNDSTLEVRYQDKNIAEVLDLSIRDAINFFSRISIIRDRLKVLDSIGLGYVKLGQASTTLSGGESQRIKIATELIKTATGKTLYILDEPTTGLHFGDIEHLMRALLSLREQGNTIIVIEHNLDVIKMADHVIDLGPEGGDGGGQIIAAGTPEEVLLTGGSYTGQFLKGRLS